MMHDRMLFVLVSLVGTPVIAHTRSGAKYEGILSAASTDGELGVVLASARLLDPPSPEAGALKKTLLISGRDLDQIEANEARVCSGTERDKGRDAFRTDTEISGTPNSLREGRSLQRWSDEPLSAQFSVSGFGDVTSDPASRDEDTFGLSTNPSSGKWDQFATNERLFGTKTDFDEELYTTKLDRSGKDFKERERRAARIAAEIMGQSTTSTHVAEERGHVDDSGADEEEKYGAVVRGPNAYIPPGARQATAAAAKANGTAPPKGRLGALSPANTKEAKDEKEQKEQPSVKLPAVSASASAPAKAATPAQSATQPAASSATPQTVVQNGPSPVKPPQVVLPPSSGTAPSSVKPEAAKASGTDPGVVGDFRQFVSAERERLERKKVALAKKEKDSKLADLLRFSQSFKLKTPMPADLAEIIAKEKDDSKKQATSSASTASLTPSAGGSGAASASTSPSAPKPAQRASLAPRLSPVSGPAKVGPRFAETKAMLAGITLPPIPPFNPEKAAAAQKAKIAGVGASPSGSPAPSAATASAAASGAAKPASPSSFKFNAKASAFKPFNPAAASFRPSVGTAGSVSSVSSPQPKPAEPAPPANPFFGTRTIKRPSMPIHVFQDFNPFKNHKVPDAATIAPLWPFQGKPYRAMFVLMPAPHHPHGHPPSHPGMSHAPPIGPGNIHMGGPGYEEDPAAAAAVAAHAAAGPHGPGGVVGAHPGQGPPGSHAGPGAQGQQGGPGQPYGMMYTPYGAPYRFPPGQPHPVQQPMQMPASQAGGPPPAGAHTAPGGPGGPGPGPMGYMHPQYVPSMPFSPPMTHAGPPPPNMYSPQMANMPPPSQQQFMPQQPYGPGGARPPPSMPNHVPQMYYQAPMGSVVPGYPQPQEMPPHMPMRPPPPGQPGAGPGPGPEGTIM